MIFVSSTVTKSLKIGPTILHEFADFAANHISNLWRFTSHFWGTNTYRVRLRTKYETNTKRNKYDTKQNTKQIKKLQMWFSQESNLALHIKKSDAGSFVHAQLFLLAFYISLRLERKKYMRKHHAVASRITKKSLQLISGGGKKWLSYLVSSSMTREYENRSPLRAFGDHRVGFLSFWQL